MQVNRRGISIRINKQRVDGDAVCILTGGRLPIGQRYLINPNEETDETASATGIKIVVIGGKPRTAQRDGIILSRAGGVAARIPENVINVVACAGGHVADKS